MPAASCAARRAIRRPSRDDRPGGGRDVGHVPRRGLGGARATRREAPRRPARRIPAGRPHAAGAQGAPLVPLADVLLFGHAERGRLLLNIGGMANVTFVPRRAVTGGAVAFDTGPGVAVVDAVTRRIDGAAAFDAGGERARRGKPSRKVLEALLADPYFAAPPPKST